MSGTKNATQSIPSDIAQLSFEQALSALEEIVRGLEKGETSLDQAIEVYDRGNQLGAHCAAKLQQAKARVEKIQFDQGTITTQPLDRE